MKFYFSTSEQNVGPTGVKCFAELNGKQNRKVRFKISRVAGERNDEANTVEGNYVCRCWWSHRVAMSDSHVLVVRFLVAVKFVLSELFSFKAQSKAADKEERSDHELRTFTKVIWVNSSYTAIRFTQQKTGKNKWRGIMALRWNNNSNNHNGFELGWTRRRTKIFRTIVDVGTRWRCRRFFMETFVDVKPNKGEPTMKHNLAYLYENSTKLHCCLHRAPKKCCMCSWRVLMDVYCISRITFFHFHNSPF